MQTNQFYRVETDTEAQPNLKEGHENDQPKERRYVFIDVVSEKELLAGLAEQETHLDEDEVTTEQAAEPPPWTRNMSVAPIGTRKHSRLLMLLIPLCLLALPAMLAGGFVYLFFFQSATVTIIPDTRQLQTTGTITIVPTGTPDAAQNQIPGRVLPAITMSQEQTAATTGLTNQPARAGRGIITFYNASPVSQTIEANTPLIGADGVQVLTDYAVTVPAEALPTFGTGIVTATATKSGQAGNIKSGDIHGYYCCLPNIQVENSAFTGGQEAETYQSVAPADIDTTAANLKTRLIQSVTEALQTQVQPTETLVTPLDCSPTVTADHQPGEKATEVQVTVSESCTAVTYDSHAFTLLLRRMQTRMAGSDLRAHYQLLSEVHALIRSIAPGETPGAATLCVQTRGTWVYAFSQRDQQHLASRIAGMSVNQATHLLTRTPGIRRVSFGSGVLLIPSNPEYIRFLFQVQQA